MPTVTSASFSTLRKRWSVWLGLGLIGLAIAVIPLNWWWMEDPQRLETAVALRVYQSFGFSVLGLVAGFLLTFLALFDIPLARASSSSERLERLLMPIILFGTFILCTAFTGVIPRFVHQDTAIVEDKSYVLVAQPDIKYDELTNLLIFECTNDWLRKCKMVYRAWHIYDYYNRVIRPNFRLAIDDGITILANEEIIVPEPIP